MLLTYFANSLRLVFMLGPGDMCEELRLQVSHPGDNKGFCRGGSGAVDHPEKQPSISGAWQSAQYRTGKKNCHITCVATIGCCHVKLSLSAVTFLYSRIVICGFLPSRRGLMHSAARPTWRAWFRCMKTCEEKDWSFPWQSWMVTPPANPNKRYKHGRCTHS